VKILGAITAFAIGATLVMGSSVAKAVPITGSFSVSGGAVTFDTTTNQIKFIDDPAANGTPVVALATGSFATAGLNGTSLLFAGQGTIATATFIDYTNLSTLPIIFSGSSSLAFSVLNNTFSEPTGGLVIDANGTLTLAGFDPTAGVFHLSTQAGAQIVTFSATVAVPGPIAGAGLPGLLAACGGLVAFARRRRQQLA
jgi:hypothetical protein